MDQLDHLQEPLDAKHLLLRGTLLKNTSWILGLVVYTGAETRMVMNSRAAKAKYPNIEKVINRSMLVVVGAQCIMALISDILYLVTKERFLSLWYLFPAGQFQSILLPEFIGYWLTFFVPLDYQRKNKFDFRTSRKVFVTCSPKFHQDSNRIFTKINQNYGFQNFRIFSWRILFLWNISLEVLRSDFLRKKSSRLYSNLMPISLYFTMEVCNAAQARAVCRWKHDLNWVFNQLGRLISLRMTWRCMTRPWFNYILYSFFMFCRWCLTFKGTRHSSECSHNVPWSWQIYGKELTSRISIHDILVKSKELVSRARSSLLCFLRQNGDVIPACLFWFWVFGCFFFRNLDGSRAIGLWWFFCQIDAECHGAEAYVHWRPWLFGRPIWWYAMKPWIQTS